MLRKIFTAVLYVALSTLLLACSNGTTPSFNRNGDTSYIIMHKGLHFEGRLAPENSLDAIEFAARVGAKYIEIDVNVTKDGEMVLLHDGTVSKKFHRADGYLPIDTTIYLNSLTLEELKRDYVLIAENPSMRRPVATLEDALKLCKVKGLYPYIEIKEDFSKKEDVEKVYEIATSIMGKGNYSLTCFTGWIIEYLRDMDSEVSLFRDMIEDVNYLKKHNVGYYPRYEPSWYRISPNYDKNIQEVHKAGLSASTWTVPKEAYDTIVVKGYDGILTDDIAPRFKIENAIFNDYSDNTFRSYNIEGTLSDNVISLSKGQSIRLKDLPIDSLYLGGMYFSVEARGKFEVKANNFHIERENYGDDYLSYHFQYLFHKERPFFELTALDDYVTVKSIWLAISEF